MRNASLPVLLAAAVLAVAASPAAAAPTAAIVGDDIVYTGVQTRDDIQIADTVGYISFKDVYNPPTAGAGCELLGTSTVRCPDAGLDQIRLDLRGGNDWVAPNNAGFEHGLRVEAGEGDDTIYAGYGQPDVLLGGPGNDHLDAGDGPGADTLRGDGDDDSLLAGDGSDDLAGGSGDDALTGGRGADVIGGGGGRDYVRYVDATGPLTVTIGAGNGDDGQPGEGDTVGGDVEDVYGGPFDDKLTGDGDGNMLQGSLGKDTLDGLGGDDRLYGDSDNDIIKGGADQDVLEGGQGTDALDGGLGADILRGGKDFDLLGGGAGSFDDSLDGGEGGDIMAGGDGTDTVTYSSRTEPVTAHPGAGATSGVAGEKDAILTDVENLIGGTAADTLTGTDGSNLLNGGSGPDTLDGLGGADSLVGATGDDTLRSRDGGTVDKDQCGLGVDTVTADAQDTVAPDCETVDLPTAEGGGGGPGGGQGGGGSQPGGGTGGKGGATATGPRVSIAKRGARTSKLATLKLVCPAKPGARCKGTLVLRGRKTVGSRKFSIAAGRSLTVRVKLGRKARKALGAKRVVKLSATATTRAAGGKTLAAKRSVKLKRRR